MADPHVHIRVRQARSACDLRVPFYRSQGLLASHNRHSYITRPSVMCGLTIRLCGRGRTQVNSSIKC